MTMVIAIPRMVTLLDLKSGAAYIQNRYFRQVSPPTMRSFEAFTNFLAVRTQLIWRDYTSSLREPYCLSQSIPKALKILGTATRNYPRRTSVTPLISLAYWPVQGPEHLETSIIPAYVQKLESARSVMPAVRNG